MVLVMFQMCENICVSDLCPVAQMGSLYGDLRERFLFWLECKRRGKKSSQCVLMVEVSVLSNDFLILLFLS